MYWEVSALKNKSKVYCEGRINQMRDELYQLIEHEKLDSSDVQKMSRELDALIMLYYKQRKGTESQVCRQTSISK